MKIKTGLAIPMMAVMSAGVGQAEQKVAVYVENRAEFPVFRAVSGRSAFG